MSASEIIQVLSFDGVCPNRAEFLVSQALKNGEGVSTIHHVKVVNTNSGMPAEFRIERIPR